MHLLLSFVLFLVYCVSVCHAQYDLDTSSLPYQPDPELLNLAKAEAESANGNCTLITNCDACVLAKDECSWCVGKCEMGTSCSNPAVSRNTDYLSCPRREAAFISDWTTSYVRSGTRYNFFTSGWKLVEIPNEFCAPGAEVGHSADPMYNAKKRFDFAVPKTDTNFSFDEDPELFKNAGGSAADGANGAGGCNWAAYIEGVFLVSAFAFILANVVCCFCPWFWCLRRCSLLCGGWCGGCRRSKDFFCGLRKRDMKNPDDAYGRIDVWVTRIGSVAASLIIFIGFITAAVGSRQLSDATSAFTGRFVLHIDSLEAELALIGVEGQAWLTPATVFVSGNISAFDSVFTNASSGARKKRYFADDADAARVAASLGYSAAASRGAAALYDASDALASLARVLHGASPLTELASGVLVELLWPRADDDGAALALDADNVVKRFTVPKSKIPTFPSDQLVADAKAKAAAAEAAGTSQLNETSSDLKEQAKIDAANIFIALGKLSEDVGVIGDGMHKVNDEIDSLNANRETLMIVYLLLCVIMSLFAVAGAILFLPSFALITACCGFCLLTTSLIAFGIHYAIAVVIADMCAFADDVGNNTAALRSVFDCSSLPGLSLLRTSMTGQMEAIYATGCGGAVTLCDGTSPCVANASAACAHGNCTLAGAACTPATMALYLDDVVVDRRLLCAGTASPSPAPAALTTCAPLVNTKLCADYSLTPTVCNSTGTPQLTVTRNATECMTSCWSAQLSEASRTVALAVPLAAQGDALWRNHMAPLLSCVRVINVIDDTKEIVCNDFFTSFATTAAGLSLISAAYVLGIIFAVRGSKRFTGSFAKKMKKVHDKVAKMGFLPKFAFYDFDGDKELSMAEIRALYKEAYPKASDDEITAKSRKMFKTMDRNDDGVVTEKEFRKACKKDAEAQEMASILAMRLKGRKHRKLKKRFRRQQGMDEREAARELDSKWDDTTSHAHEHEEGARTHEPSKQLQRAEESKRRVERGGSTQAMLSPRAEKKLKEKGHHASALAAEQAPELPPSEDTVDAPAN